MGGSNASARARTRATATARVTASARARARARAQASGLPTYLCVTLADECIARDEMRNDALRPRIGSFPVVEGHHQLPQMRLTALREIFQDAPFRLSNLGGRRKGLRQGQVKTK